MSQSAFRALLSQDKDNLTLSARAARPIGQDPPLQGERSRVAGKRNSSDAPTINARRRLDREHPGKEKGNKNKVYEFRKARIH